jgi:hypothetical protein
MAEIGSKLNGGLASCIKQVALAMALFDPKEAIPSKT